MIYESGGIPSRVTFFASMLATMPNAANTPFGPVQDFPFAYGNSPSLMEKADDADSLAWVAANMDTLRKEHPPDSWILVRNCQVVGAGADLVKVLQEADEGGIDKPPIIRIENPSTARRSAYTTWFTSRSS